MDYLRQVKIESPDKDPFIQDRLKSLFFIDLFAVFFLFCIALINPDRSATSLLDLVMGNIQEKMFPVKIAPDRQIHVFMGKFCIEFLDYTFGIFFR